MTGQKFFCALKDWLKHNIVGLSLSGLFIAIYIAEECAGAGFYNALCACDWDTMNWQLYRLLTSAFMHSSPFHLLTNVAATICACSLVEREIGWWRALLFFLVGSVLGELIFCHCATYSSSCGASGGIFALIAAFAVTWLRYPQRFVYKWWRVDLYYTVVYFFVANNNAFSVIAHAFGLALGIVFAVILLLFKCLVKRDKNAAQPPVENEVEK